MHALAASCEELRARTGNPPLDSISRGFCVYNIVLFCTNSRLHMVFTTTTAAICGHATLGKPKRSRQTVDFMLIDENDGKQ